MKIGIIGGVGPLVGAELQRRIIEATPAGDDQEHLEIVCYANPKIPDRTESTADDGGGSYVEEVVYSAGMLVKSGVSVIAVPYNTAHARIEEIKRRVPVPVVGMVETAVRGIMKRHGVVAAGLLATADTVGEKAYECPFPGCGIRWVAPSEADIDAVEEITSRIRSGDLSGHGPRLKRLASRMAARGADVLVLGCAELSLLNLGPEALGLPVVDPLEMLAERLVFMARMGNAVAGFKPRAATSA